MIKIKKLSELTLPLKSLKNSINSVIFSIDDKKNLALNVKSQDGAQIVNLKWNSDIVEIPKNLEKMGIYNLGEFLTALEMFGGEEVSCKVNENKLDITYKSNENTEVKYNLSDVTLIQEGPEGPKNPIDYFITLSLDDKFLKKVKNIATSLNVNTLKFECKKGEVSFAISDKYFHSHVVRESLLKNSECKTDFEIYLNIEKLNIIPENKPLTMNIHDKIVEFIMDVKEDGKKESKNWNRYFIAPLTIE